jgi:hypothetical protein
MTINVDSLSFLFEKTKLGPWDQIAVCMFLYVYPPLQPMNAWTNYDQTWYV